MKAASSSVPTLQPSPLATLQPSPVPTLQPEMTPSLRTLASPRRLLLAGVLACCTWLPADPLAAPTSPPLLPTVVHETERLLVICKPPGLSFHSTDSDGAPGVTKVMREMQRTGEMQYTGAIHPIHRLDKVTHRRGRRVERARGEPPGPEDSFPAHLASPAKPSASLDLRRH